MANQGRAPLDQWEELRKRTDQHKTGDALIRRPRPRGPRRLPKKMRGILYTSPNRRGPKGQWRQKRTRKRRHKPVRRSLRTPQSSHLAVTFRDAGIAKVGIITRTAHKHQKQGRNRETKDSRSRGSDFCQPHIGSATIGDARLLLTRVEVRGAETIAALDSGATHNYVKPHLVKGPLLPAPSRTDLAAMGVTAAELTGRTKMTFQARGQSFTIEAFVMPRARQDVVLGNTFLREEKAVIDYNRLVLHCGAEKRITLSLMGREPQQTSGAPLPRTGFPAELKPQVDKVLRDFEHVLMPGPGRLVGTKTIQHEIHLTNPRPFQLTPYHYSEDKRIEIERQVQEMLANGVIEPQQFTLQFTDRPSEEKGRTMAVLTKKQLLAFLGTCNWLQEYVPRLATTLAPLTDLLREKRGLRWTGPAQRAFEEVKTALNHPLRLARPLKNEKYILQTDASSRGMGAVLFQQPEGEGRRIIAYASAKFSVTEEKYHCNEQECLAVVWAIKRFRPYLEDRPFILRTDSRTVTWLNRFKGTRDKLMRWALLLQEFQFTLEHCPGRHNELPDHLSRNPCEETPEDLGDTERILPPTPKVVEEEEQGPCIGQAATVDLRDMIHDAQRNDPHPPDLNHERGYRKQGELIWGRPRKGTPLEAVCADSHPPRASATVPRLSRSRTPGVGRDSPGTATPLLLARHAAGHTQSPKITATGRGIPEGHPLPRRASPGQVHSGAREGGHPCPGRLQPGEGEAPPRPAVPGPHSARSSGDPPATQRLEGQEGEREVGSRESTNSCEEDPGEEVAPSIPQILRHRGTEPYCRLTPQHQEEKGPCDSLPHGTF
ncbi:unnamed protein product [Trichogramma brassicae]|uniref:RNA-directed DNA polymerase n=1 Tax=Trichogramma brassicae TaxID=86971 RepID=A0A6H5I7H0_9HYME|nr:unnamed protein product [Trichogramma brassicae]